jgi:hypothetical protein
MQQCTLYPSSTVLVDSCPLESTHHLYGEVSFQSSHPPLSWKIGTSWEINVDVRWKSYVLEELRHTAPKVRYARMLCSSSLFPAKNYPVGKRNARNLSLNLFWLALLTSECRVWLSYGSALDVDQSARSPDLTPKLFMG